jgi:hypothetical protein
LDDHPYTSRKTFTRMINQWKLVGFFEFSHSVNTSFPSLIHFANFTRDQRLLRSDTMHFGKHLSVFSTNPVPPSSGQNRSSGFLQNFIRRQVSEDRESVIRSLRSFKRFPHGLHARLPPSSHCYVYGLTQPFRLKPPSQHITVRKLQIWRPSVQFFFFFTFTFVCPCVIVIIIHS